MPIKIVGPAIPQGHNNRIQKNSLLKPEELIVLPVMEGLLSDKANVLAIEGYGAVAGDMEALVSNIPNTTALNHNLNNFHKNLLKHKSYKYTFTSTLQILRKVCQDGAECLGKDIACFEPAALCAGSGMCSDSCTSFPLPRTQYTVVKTFKLTITEGHFHLKANSAFRMLPGDIVAIKSKGGQLAFRETLPREMSDYKISELENPNTFAAEKFQKLDKTKHLIRLVLSEPLALTIPHEFEESGHYQIKLSLTNEWSPHDIRRARSINIQSTISKIRLVVNPQNAAVRQRVDISIQLSRGSNIKILWDFGDGTTTEDHILSSYNNDFSI